MQADRTSVTCPSKSMRRYVSLIKVALSKQGTKGSLCSFQSTVDHTGQTPSPQQLECAPISGLLFLIGFLMSSYEDHDSQALVFYLIFLPLHHTFSTGSMEIKLRQLLTKEYNTENNASSC